MGCIFSSDVNPINPQNGVAKAFMTDFTGQANNCRFLDGNSLDGESCLSYLIPGENAMILLKAEKFEYLFTDHGLIIIEGIIHALYLFLCNFTTNSLNMNLLHFSYSSRLPEI